MRYSAPNLKFEVQGSGMPLSTGRAVPPHPSPLPWGEGVAAPDPGHGRDSADTAVVVLCATRCSWGGFGGLLKSLLYCGAE